MEQERYQLGLEKLREIDGEAGQAVIDALREIAPDLGKYIIEFAFGDIYSRGGLTMAERELITVACLLTAGGCEPQLTVHLNGALNVGISQEKLVELFLHCIPYTGFPRALNAVSTAKVVFAARKPR